MAHSERRRPTVEPRATRSELEPPRPTVSPLMLQSGPWLRRSEEESDFANLTSNTEPSSKEEWGCGGHADRPCPAMNLITRALAVRSTMPPGLRRHHVSRVVSSGSPAAQRGHADGSHRLFFGRWATVSRGTPAADASSEAGLPSVSRA